jgi:HTH-type transcriptional regulator/antitoxin HigA
MGLGGDRFERGDAHGKSVRGHDDEEFEACTHALFPIDSSRESVPPSSRSNWTSDLVGRTLRGKHDPISAADAVCVVRFLLEQQDLTQRDLIPEFGSASAVSMFPRKRRKLTLEQVRKLRFRFKLPAAIHLKRIAMTNIVEKQRRPRCHGRRSAECPFGSPSGQAIREPYPRSGRLNAHSRRAQSATLSRARARGIDLE